MKKWLSKISAPKNENENEESRRAIRRKLRNATRAAAYQILKMQYGEDGMIIESESIVPDDGSPAAPAPSPEFVFDMSLLNLDPMCTIEGTRIESVYPVEGFPALIEKYKLPIIGPTGFEPNNAATANTQRTNDAWWNPEASLPSGAFVIAEPLDGKSMKEIDGFVTSQKDIHRLPGVYPNRGPAVGMLNKMLTLMSRGDTSGTDPRSFKIRKGTYDWLNLDDLIARMRKFKTGHKYTMDHSDLTKEALFNVIWADCLAPHRIQLELKFRYDVAYKVTYPTGTTPGVSGPRIVTPFAVRANHGIHKDSNSDISLCRTPMPEKMDIDVPLVYHCGSSNNHVSIDRNGLDPRERNGIMCSIFRHDDPLHRNKFMQAYDSKGNQYNKRDVIYELNVKSIRDAGVSFCEPSGYHRDTRNPLFADKP